MVKISLSRDKEICAPIVIEGLTGEKHVKRASGLQFEFSSWRVTCSNNASFWDRGRLPSRSSAVAPTMFPGCWWSAHWAAQWRIQCSKDIHDDLLIKIKGKSTRRPQRSREINRNTGGYNAHKVKLKATIQDANANPWGKGLRLTEIWKWFLGIVHRLISEETREGNNKIVWDQAQPFSSNRFGVTLKELKRKTVFVVVLAHKILFRATRA